MKRWLATRNRMAACVAFCIVAAGACASGIRRGPDLPGADAIARDAIVETRVKKPMRVVFNWEYTGEKGRLRGEGIARVNPPDLFRLDFFGPGEGAMQAALVDGILSATGDLEGLELPPATFLYAMAGLFRPPTEEPLSGFMSGPYRVFEFEEQPGLQQFFFLSGGRLARLEEHRGGQRERWIILDRGKDPYWPDEASYRDTANRNGVKWELTSASAVEEAYDDAIYSVPGHR